MALLNRTVGVVRLSRHSKRADDPSTSPDRQRNVIKSDRSLHLVGWAEDLGVSAAKVPPWERPGLSEWLRRPEDWDTLAFWKLDRLVRSVGDFAEMVKWARGKPNSTGLPPVDKPKNLVSITDKIDLNSPMGRAMAGMIAVFAELEADIIQERVNDARAEMYASGRWPGGRYPYGYRPVQRAEGGWELEVVPEEKDIILQFVALGIAGKPFFPLQMKLEEAGVPTPKGGKTWRNVNVGSMMRSRALLGEYTFKSINGEDGIPVDPVRAEPLISVQEFNQLQEALAGNPKRVRETGVSLLNGIGFCAFCGEPMYHRTMKESIKKSGGRRKGYRYYGCGGQWSRRNDCKVKALRGEWIEDAVAEIVLAHIGDLEIMRKQRIGGVSHAAEIAELETALEDLLARSEGKGPAVLKAYQKRIDAVEAKLEALAAIPEREPEVRLVSTGQTYADAWESADVDGRRELLQAAELTVFMANPQEGREFHAVKQAWENLKLTEGNRYMVELEPSDTGSFHAWLIWTGDMAQRIQTRMSA
ncbi:recombinase family protein [Micromonospora sp. WMMD718]|uniref:recombinase family protein n=1 Tax=unclassified Micromonospora TaxID=2617518 RepID=UPI0009E53584|nr:MULTISPECIES: recombinase family protein [unclassified Micromonospora]MDG4750608.1 recombinase family protein [Micromonospora sp. WMMD718]